MVVGPRSALARDRVRLRAVNWLGGAASADGMSVTVKLRSAQPAVPARLFAGSDDGGATLALDQPQEGVAPGQAAVFYQGERVLGGGWIVSAALAAQAA